MKTKTGLDILAENDFSKIKNHKIGILVNPASLDRSFNHIIDLLGQDKHCKIEAIFGPQHGFYGHTQDNMIEWEGFKHPIIHCPVYSLYGNHRSPTDEMLDNIEIMVIDLPDVGARYYTFLWTAFFMLQACERKKIKVVVLDRPNPITGNILEGPGIKENFYSFVGLYPVIIRHGLTFGEALTLIHREMNINTELEVITMSRWTRNMWFDETDLPWIIPSPNMPTLETAIVYPGGCLIEGTLLSEGRGTTKPFEIIGAPYIEPELLKKDLDTFNLKGVFFRPIYFEPTFNKYCGKICGGIQLHITDRNLFESVKTFVAILCAVRRRYPEENIWRKPPYEYEYEKLPFDILSGSEELRKAIDRGDSPHDISHSWSKDREDFEKRRTPYLFYS